MRKVILIGCLLATMTSNAWGGMPMFNTTTDTQSATTTTKKSDGNWFTRMWKKEEKSEPTFFYQVEEEKPTTTERVTSALTDNAAVRTARNWVTPSKDDKPTELETSSFSTAPEKPTPALMRSMAQLREGSQDIEGARDFYLQALAANPKNVETLRELGHFEDRQGRLVDAERYYAQAVNLAPKNPAALNDLALCLARQDKFASSVSVLERAIALEPTKSLYRNNIATVLMQLGEQHQAMQHLMAVHSLPAAYYNMGHLLEKADQTEAAAAHYAEALRLDPAMKPAELALVRLAPAQQTEEVAQTAMAPAAAAVPEMPNLPSINIPKVELGQTEWPSTAITPSASQSTTKEPDFGPQLLPPME